jgi:hypothetical protein
MTAHIRRYHPQLLSHGIVQLKSTPKLPATVTTEEKRVPEKSKPYGVTHYNLDTASFLVLCFNAIRQIDLLVSLN